MRSVWRCFSVLAVAALITAAFGTSICLCPAGGQGGTEPSAQTRLLETMKTSVDVLLFSAFHSFFPFAEVMASETPVSVLLGLI